MIEWSTHNPNYDIRLICNNLIWGIAAARSIYIPNLNYIRSGYIATSTSLVISFPPAAVPVAWGILLIEAINFGYSTEWKKALPMIAVPLTSKCIDFVLNAYVVKLKLPFPKIEDLYLGVLLPFNSLVLLNDLYHTNNSLKAWQKVYHTCAENLDYVPVISEWCSKQEIYCHTTLDTSESFKMPQDVSNELG